MLIHYSFYIPVEHMEVQKIGKIRTITIKLKKKKAQPRYFTEVAKLLITFQITFCILPTISKYISEAEKT